MHSLDLKFYFSWQMSPSLDINLLPLAREAGKDQSSLSGLLAAEPPRRQARGRTSDRLILYLTLAGNAPLSPGKQDQILERVAQAYYKTTGSVTAALRMVAETLNHYLLDRNLRNASSGRQAVGWLSLLALRGDQLYLAQSGPVHAFIITADQVKHLFDPQISGRGLGLSRTTPIRYSHAVLQPNDAVLLATQPSPTWSASTLAGIHGQGLEGMRRRLLHSSDVDLNAVLIQTRPGSGQIHRLRLKTPDQPAPEEQPARVEPESAGSTLVVQPLQAESDVPQETSAASESVAAPGAGQVPQVEAESKPGLEQEGTAAPGTGEVPPDLEEDASPSEADLAEKEFTLQTAVGKEAAPTSMTPAPPGVEQPALAPRPARVDPARTAPAQAVPMTPTTDAAQASAPGAAARRARNRPAPNMSLAPIGGFLVGIGRPVGAGFARLVQGLGALLKRVLPDESLFTLPAGTMALIAILIPLLVVTMASVVYLQKGRAAQYDVLFNQAGQAASEAGSLSDLVTQRLAWQTALKYLDEAETYRITPESQALREQARTALDELNLIKRPDYQPAIIGGLPDVVKVTRLVLSDDDLYMLDGNSGNVLRGRVTNNLTFEIDRSFQCGPGIYDGHVVGQLIDITPAPAGIKTGEVVLGMDTAGSALYCFTGDSPKTQPLARPVTAPNWGSLVGFTLDPDQNNVFVLDPFDQAVWAFWGSDFTDGPTFFFGDEVPTLQDVIALTVDKEDLYLLHTDGHMTLCTYSSLAVSPTRCADPVLYMDTRPGQEGQVLTPETPFSQVLATQPPDPSLYVLEPGARAIYHFSLRTLTFHRQFVPGDQLPAGDATAFTVNQLQRILYLAIGNRVYQASMP